MPRRLRGCAGALFVFGGNHERTKRSDGAVGGNLEAGGRHRSRVPRADAPRSARASRRSAGRVGPQEPVASPEASRCVLWFTHNLPGPLYLRRITPLFSSSSNLSNPRPFSRLGATAAGNTSRRGMTFFRGSKHMTGAPEPHRSHRPAKRNRNKRHRAERQDLESDLTDKSLQT